jgi:hypothetical protein
MFHEEILQNDFYAKDRYILSDSEYQTKVDEITRRIRNEEG